MDPYWSLINLGPAGGARRLGLAYGGPALSGRCALARTVREARHVEVTILDSQAPILVPLRREDPKFGVIVSAPGLPDLVDDISIPGAVEQWLGGPQPTTPRAVLVLVPDAGSAGEERSYEIDCPPPVVASAGQLQDRPPGGVDVPEQRVPDATLPRVEQDPLPGAHFERAVLAVAFPSGPALVVDYWCQSTREPWTADQLLEALLTRFDRLSNLRGLPSLARAVDSAPPRRETGPGAPSLEWSLLQKRRSGSRRMSLQYGGPARGESQMIAVLDRGGGELLLLDTQSSELDPVSRADPVRSNELIDAPKAGQLLSSRFPDEARRRLRDAVSPGEIRVMVRGLAPHEDVEVRAPRSAVDETGWTSLTTIPLTDRPGLGLGAPGQMHRLYRESGSPVPGLLVGIVAPSGERLAIEYCPAMPAGAAFMHDLLQTIASSLVNLSCFPHIAFSFQGVQTRILTPARRPAGEALRDTLDRARSILAEYEGDAAARDDLLQLLLRDPVEEDRIRKALASYAAPYESFAAVTQGNACLALLVIESQIEALTRADAEDAEAFADALTAYQRANAGQHGRTGPRITSRVLNFVHEWMRRRQLRPHRARMSIDFTLLDPIEIDRLEQLLVNAPWLAWFSRNAVGAKLCRVELDDRTLVEVMGLVRPRTRYRPGTIQSPNPGNYQIYFEDLTIEALQEHYVLPERLRVLGERDREVLDNLARACESVWFTPHDTRRAVQALKRLGPAADILDELAAESAGLRTAGADDLAVLADWPGPDFAPRTVLVNTNPFGRMLITLAERNIELAEYAASTPDASSYASVPITVPADLPDPEQGFQDRSLVLGIAGRECRFDLGQRDSIESRTLADTEWVSPALFRGRQTQLRRLLGTMQPGLLVRTPSAIFGPRRAGKTTLAIHAGVRGVEQGLLSGFAKIDMFIEPDGTRADGYAERLSQVLTERVAAEVGVTIAESATDPVAVLMSLDRALRGRRPVGLVLDEFDTLLSHDPGSPLEALVTRLGGMRWENLVIVATVQRFYSKASELETWQMIECPADLSWHQGVTYFCQPLLEVEAGARGTLRLRSPIVIPMAFRNNVASRVGLRPYFWGRLRNDLENRLDLDGGYALVEQGLLDELIDRLLEEDPYLALPTQPTEGVSLSECRRRDLFTENEKRILAAFATRPRHALNLDEARRLGGEEGIRELRERAYAAEAYGQFRLSVPLFNEYLRSHPLDFADYLTRAETVP